MRLYTLTHFMLSGMAKGIQAEHSTVELFNKYASNPSNNKEVSAIEPTDMLWGWSLNHKVIISLNGGLTPDLMGMIEFLERESCPYPWAYFNEDESLGNLVTSISLVLPEKIYETASLIKNKVVEFGYNRLIVLDWEKYNEQFSLYVFESLQKQVNDYGAFTDFEKELISKMNSYRLANI